MLCSKFCLHFFPISKVVSLRKDVLNFRQLEEKSLGTSWDRFNELIIIGLECYFGWFYHRAGAWGKLDSQGDRVRGRISMTDRSDPREGS